jgi:glucose dehydrogenase
MSDIIPAVFNRMDFWAMLLPGYFFVILGMTLFFPSFLQNNTAAPARGTGSISFDIFAAVVAIVAGPAIGFTLSQAVLFFHL